MENLDIQKENADIKEATAQAQIMINKLINLISFNYFIFLYYLKSIPLIKLNNSLIFS